MCIYSILLATELWCDEIAFFRNGFFWFGLVCSDTKETPNVFPIFDYVSPKRMNLFFFFWLRSNFGRSKRRHRQLKLIAFKAKSKMFLFLGNLFRFGKLQVQKKTFDLNCLKGTICKTIMKLEKWLQKLFKFLLHKVFQFNCFVNDSSCITLTLK